MNTFKEFLDKKVTQFNQEAFIPNDPISVPHKYTVKQDIEIAGLFAALFAWGNRTTIISKANELMQLMHNAPYQFVMQFQENDLKPFVTFKHRTFNYVDILYLLEWLQMHYKKHKSLEQAFTINFSIKDINVESGLTAFYNYVFSLPHAPKRTHKHISTPAKNSACKRLNMFLRWMVRKDKAGVDFGIWKTIKPSQLICPFDIHVSRVAKRFGLIDSTDNTWKQAVKLTEALKVFDANDPVKYDFALFSLGAEEKYS